MLGQIKSVKFSDELAKEKKRSVFSKLLPFLVLVSFSWLHLYGSLTLVNKWDLINGNSVILVSISLLLTGLIYYFLFEILFFAYRFMIGFSIYSFMIPKQVLKDKFRFWYFLRNIVLGFIYNLRFFFPYLTIYLCLFELLFNMLFLLGMFFDLKRNYVEALVAQFVFRTMSVPVFIYTTVRIIMMISEVL